MIGKYELEITTRRVDYKLTLERNITILRGNSATGKSTLYRAVKQYEDDAEPVALELHVINHV